jgi:predicted aldo/keto reductase-like oxidoreductase
MDYQKLGRTGLDVSLISVGTEHMNGQPREMVVSVIREAVERGVNYFDVIFAHPEYLDNMRAAFHGCRDRVLLTAHLGSTEKSGQYLKSRNARSCETFFHAHLSQLNTDHVDALFLHNFNSLKDWDRIVRPGGVLELAQRLRTEGKARTIGISGHYADVVEKAVESGVVDVVMFPVNMFSHAMPGRKELLEHCVRQDVGVVAMKPFGGGKLLNKRGTFRVPKYQTSGEAFKAKLGTGVTPVQCLSYTLAQVGVSMALSGVKNSTELAGALQLLEASEAERDFSSLLTGFGRYEEGECVYCNHCLPCPVVIDIGQVNRLLDAAQWGLTDDLQRAYDRLPVRASACTECGACVERCPFGVEVIATMQQAVEIFEVAGARQGERP